MLAYFQLNLVSSCALFWLYNQDACACAWLGSYFKALSCISCCLSCMRVSLSQLAVNPIMCSKQHSRRKGDWKRPRLKAHTVLGCRVAVSNLRAGPTKLRLCLSYLCAMSVIGLIVLCARAYSWKDAIVVRSLCQASGDLMSTPASNTSCVVILRKPNDLFWPPFSLCVKQTFPYYI